MKLTFLKGVLHLAQNEMQKHLDKGTYGTPLVNPDEQHKYMGTFRERCYLTMTIRQMKAAQNQTALAKEIAQHPDATLLLNGKSPENLQTVYIQLATKNNLRFTIVNDFVSDDLDSFGAILAAKEAVNVEVVDVEKKYPIKTEEKPEKKEGFWKRLFK